MKKIWILVTIIAVLAGISALYAEHISEENARDARIQSFNDKQDREIERSRKQVHDATCALHAGDRAALDLHGCK